MNLSGAPTRSSSSDSLLGWVVGLAIAGTAVLGLDLLASANPGALQGVTLLPASPAPVSSTQSTTNSAPAAARPTQVTRTLYECQKGDARWLSEQPCSASTVPAKSPATAPTAQALSPLAPTPAAPPAPTTAAPTHPRPVLAVAADAERRHDEVPIKGLPEVPAPKLTPAEAKRAECADLAERIDVLETEARLAQGAFKTDEVTREARSLRAEAHTMGCPGR